MTNEEKHRCPPHHFVIDSEGIGHCKYCPAVKDFGKAIRRQQEKEEEVSSRGGRKARGVKRKPYKSNKPGRRPKCKPLSAKADSFSLPDPDKGGREVWLVYGSPTSDNAGSDGISGRGETAGYTRKKGLRGTVMLINTTTYRAGSGSVLGVNEFDHHTCEPSLIFYKVSELVECPRVLLSPLALPNRDSVSDTAQVLQSNTPSSAFSLFNNPLADCVVDIRGEALFLSGAFFDKPQGCFGAFGLELGAKFGMVFAETVQMPARINHPIGVRCYIHYAEVYAQKAVRLIRCWLRGINHNCQIKDATTENEVRLSHLPINPRFLICAYSDGDSLSAFEGKNRNLVQSLPREDTLVVDHSRVGLEKVLRLPIYLITLRNLGYCSHSHLRRKFVVLAKMVVGEMVKVILPECAAFKGNLGCVIAGFVKPLHCLKEGLVLLLVGSKFNHQGLFHTSIVECFNLQVKSKERGMGEFLCPLKGAVSFA